MNTDLAADPTPLRLEALCSTTRRPDADFRLGGYVVAQRSR
jgi:hypothetical protein